ncbi:MAG: oligosaccharide flippase family protein [Alistipes sp.]|nr:oligosaccharide flippase family protein [Alistipes sp.]
MGETRTSAFFKGVSIQTVITIILGILEILVFAIISRLLSKTDFGYFAAITGVITIFMSISEAGIGASIIQKKDASKEFLSTAFTWSTIIGVIISLIILLCAPLIATTIADDTLTLPLRIMSVTILFHSIISVGNGVLYRQLDFKKVGIIRIVSYLIASIVSIIMALRGCGLYSIVAQPIISTIISVLLLLKYVEFPKFSIYKKETKEIISYSGWLTLGVIFNNITQQLDRLLLPRWISVETLGAYNRPAGFVSTISMKINGIFDTVLFPILSDLQNDKSRVKDILLMATSLLNSFSIILFAIFFFNAELIITIFFGEQWLDLTAILQIISISLIFNINGRLVDCFFRSLAYVKLGFTLRVIEASITFYSIYIGSGYGIVGVATAIVIANIMSILLKMCCLTIKTNVSFIRILLNIFNAWKPILPLLIIGIPFLAINQHSLAIDICFAALFGSIIIIEFGFFPKYIGESYYQRVYPYVSNIKNKVIGGRFRNT